MDGGQARWASGLLIRFGRFPELDGIALRIVRSRKPAVRKGLGIDLHTDPGGLKLRDHRIEVTDPEIDHPLLFRPPEIFRAVIERRKNGHPGVLLPATRLIAVGNRIYAEVFLIPARQGGGILRAEKHAAEKFFGEPTLKISDMMRTTPDGRGAISVLAADKLMMNPRLYGTFLLWLLSELFEELPEVGDPDKPRLVFFFDEAHLLFDEAPKILIERVEQVVRLIRSKGVGVYFVTQNPLDVPESVLSQLGNRIQHALRAYTPREQKAVKTAAETFRPNPEFDCFEAITQLGVGEALVSTLESKGVPTVVQRTLIRPPSSRLGPLTDGERRSAMSRSPVAGFYDEDLDRDSAFEILKKRAEDAAKAEEERRRREEEDEEDLQESRRWTLPGFGDDDYDERGRKRSSRRRRRSTSRRQSVAEAAMKSAARSVASTLGRALVRGILGSLKKGL